MGKLKRSPHIPCHRPANTIPQKFFIPQYVPGDKDTYHSIIQKSNEFQAILLSFGSNLEMKTLNNRLAELTERTVEMLTKRSISATDVIQVFPLLPPRLRHNYFTYLKKMLSTGELPVSPEDLYQCVHFGLLKVAIDAFGSWELQNDVRKFVQDVFKLRKDITVEEYLENSHSVVEPLAPGHSEMTLKVEKDVHVCTLEDVDNIRKDFIEEFAPKMSEVLVYLREIKQGSIILTWGMPDKEAQEMNDVILQVQNTKSRAYWWSTSLAPVPDLLIAMRMVLLVCEQQCLQPYGFCGVWKCFCRENRST